MPAKKDEIINKLSDLRETNKDLQQTYETAAENVAKEDLRSKFQAYSEKNGRFALELEQELERLGERSESKGSFVGTLHRGFMDLRSKLSGDDPQSVIEECARAENMAIQSYEEALNVDFPPQIQSMVSKQFGELKQTYSQLEELKRSKY